MSILDRIVKSQAGTAAVGSILVLCTEAAYAQGVAVGAMPTGRFAGVATTTLGYICITLGIVCVALGLIYGLFQMVFRSEGIGIVVKSLLIGAFMGLVLPLAVWTVGTTPTTAVIPQPGGTGGGIF
jgi:hypothetical protein